MQNRYRQTDSISGRRTPARQLVLAPVGKTLPASVTLAAPGYDDAVNPLRRLLFFVALAFVFIRFSYIHEWINTVLHIRTYMFAILAPLAYTATALSGGIQRAFKKKPTVYWACLAAWLIIAGALSWWKAGSAALLSGYFMNEFPILFVIGGTTVTWRECKMMIQTIAFGATINVLAGGHYGGASSGRFSLDFGSIANANDLAAYLIFTLPFILFLIVKPKSSWVIRLGAAAVFTYGVYLAGATASRGGLVAIFASATFVFLRGSALKKLVFLVTVPVLALVFLASMPTSVTERWATMFANSQDMTDEAVASRETRKYLLKTSLRFTLEHPLFGVGPGQFTDYEGATAQERGLHKGAWQVTHNSYTQLSSEAGIPALVFLIGALFCTFRILHVTNRSMSSARPSGQGQGRASPVQREIAVATYCLMLAMVGFCASIFFLSLMYTYYLPAMSGLSVAVAQAAQTEFPSEKAVPGQGTGPQRVG